MDLFTLFEKGHYLAKTNLLKQYLLIIRIWRSL